MTDKSETNELLSKILKELEDNNYKLNQLITLQQFQQSSTTNKFIDPYAQKEWGDNSLSSKRFGHTMPNTNKNSDIQRMIDEARNKAKNMIAEKMEEEPRNK